MDITNEQYNALKDIQPFDTLMTGTVDNYVIEDAALKQWASNDTESIYDELRSIAINLGKVNLPIEIFPSESISISPAIESISGVLQPNISKEVVIQGVNILTDTELIIEDSVVDNITRTPNSITAMVTCSTIGDKSIQITNGGASSIDWGTFTIKCLELPTGAEQIFNTNYSARSYYANNATYNIDKAFDGNTGTSHYCGSGQVNGHWIQIDFGAPTVVTKIGMTHQSTRSSTPFTIQGSDDGTNFVDRFDLTIPSTGEEQDIESQGQIMNSIRIVWSNPNGTLSNTQELIVKGRQ